MLRFVLFLPLVCLPGSTADAQSCLNTGALAGVVLDPTGAVIQGASIQISTSGQLQHAFSGGDGRWTIPCLASGTYKVQVSSTGFQSTQSGPIQVSSDKTRSITTKLPIASVTEDSDVTSTDASSQSGGANILSQKQLEGLAEDPDDFQRQLQALSAASGGMPGSALITVDGFQSPSALPPKSSIQEVRISPDMFSAEYEYPPMPAGGSRCSRSPARTTFTAPSSGC